MSAYNQYTRVSHDAAYDPALENYQMLYRPLFITSYMLADFLQDNDFFGARRLVFSSASSKTAYGTAFCLQDVPGLTLTALTSAGNQAFVDSLGAYHESATYDELESLAADVPRGSGELAKFKEMLDAGLITQEDYDAAKAKALGLYGVQHVPAIKVFSKPAELNPYTACNIYNR